jgi:hypothetical protein
MKPSEEFEAFDSAMDKILRANLEAVRKAMDQERRDREESVRLGTLLRSPLLPAAIFSSRRPPLVVSEGLLIEVTE